jgi:hypothetical protein
MLKEDIVQSDMKGDYGMHLDYQYVIKALKNKGNKLIHYSALKNLISIFKTKWSLTGNKNTLEVYLHSLNNNLKSSVR